MPRPYRPPVEPAGAPRRAPARAGAAVPPGHLLLGAVAGAHGIQGAVKIKTFTGDPAAIGDYGPLIDDLGRTHVVKVQRTVPGAVIARLDGITDRNAAEALRGIRFHVPRAALPEPDDDEFYHADLLGMSVVDAAGEAIGTVATVQDFGAGDVMEIRLVAGGMAWLPFTRAMVPEVDVAGRRMVAVPPEDWLLAPEPEESYGEEDGEEYEDEDLEEDPDGAEDLA